jgi:hypothetical protein
MASVQVSEAEHAELVAAFERTAWTYPQLASRAAVSEKSAWNVMHSHENGTRVRVETLASVQDALGLQVVPRNPSWVVEMVQARLNALDGQAREDYVQALMQLSAGKGK